MDTFLAILKQMDHSWFEAINSHHTPFFDSVFRIITQFGNGWVVAPILIGFAFWKFRKAKLWPVLIVSTIAMVLPGMANNSAKATASRERPVVYYTSHNGMDGASFTVHVVGDTLRLRSFPSGHTNTAFSAAAVLSVIGGGWFWCAYAVAAAVAYSRVYMGVHFPFDTMVGALLGMAIAYLIWGLAARILKMKWSFTRGIER